MWRLFVRVHLRLDVRTQNAKTESFQFLEIADKGEAQFKRIRTCIIVAVDVGRRCDNCCRRARKSDVAQIARVTEKNGGQLTRLIPLELSDQLHIALRVVHLLLERFGWVSNRLVAAQSQELPILRRVTARLENREE